MEERKIMYDLYDVSTKIDGLYYDYVDIFYTQNGEVIKKDTKRIDFRSVENIFESYDFKMTKFVFYSRPVGLIYDIEVQGKPCNYGKMIYFGKRKSVMHYNMTHDNKINLPLNKELIVCDNGEVITEFEPMSATSQEVMLEINRLKDIKIKHL